MWKRNAARLLAINTAWRRPSAAALAREAPIRDYPPDGDYSRADGFSGDLHFRIATIRWEYAIRALPRFGLTGA